MDAEADHANLFLAVLRRVLEPLSLMLLAAGIVSVVTGDVIGRSIIMAILLLSIGLETLQEGQTVRAAEMLRRGRSLQRRR